MFRRITPKDCSRHLLLTLPRASQTVRSTFTSASSSPIPPGTRGAPEVMQQSRSLAAVYMGFSGRS